ncbi:unnamed protein product [Taenia asiatica]|uniref:Ig-like domain-containing protein n=1 Tax=Taenia asiatica TaxID=60517 RepID=A0A158R7I1_TAEAS|nr:unnamed protein product [Taenia asiatica]
MLSAFIQTLLWVQCLAQDLDFTHTDAKEKIMSPALVAGGMTPLTVARSASQVLRQPRRTAISSSDCVIPSKPHPCLLKPTLKNVPTQAVLSESLNGREYRVKMEAKEGSIVYLPCNTLRELRNETVIWDHNMSTIAVMGTLFTMDSRIDVATTPKNRFHRCSYLRSLASSVPRSPGDYFKHLATDQSDVFEAWELVIENLQISDSGAYHCRLTGGQPQSLLYQLSVKKSIPQARVSPKQIVRIDAPRYARRQSPANFTCSMQATHDESSQVIIDWYRTPSGRRGAGALRVMESQAWNNVSVYKEILGYSREGLRLDAVMQFHSCDYQHAGVYECQAHRITQNERSRVYDSLTVEFTGDPILINTEPQIDPLSLERLATTLYFDERLFSAFSRVVLSDSPTEKQKGQRQSEQQWIRTPHTKNWTLFMEAFRTTSAVSSLPCVNVVTAVLPFFCLLFSTLERLR